MEKRGADAIDKKTKKALNDAVDAMSQWREELLDVNQRGGERVVNRLAVVAQATGWPDSMIYNMAKQLLQSSRLQNETLERMMEPWEKQLSLLAEEPPTALGAPGQSANATMTPMHLWMQSMESWRNWMEAMSRWPNETTRNRGDASHRHSD